MNKNKVYVRMPGFPWKMVENNAVIVDVGENRALNLTEVGAEIWGCLDGRKAVGEIVDNICIKFDVKKVRAYKDTITFLRLLLKEELIKEISVDLK